MSFRCPRSDGARTSAPQFLQWSACVDFQMERYRIHFFPFRRRNFRKGENHRLGKKPESTTAIASSSSLSQMGQTFALLGDSSMSGIIEDLGDQRFLHCRVTRQSDWASSMMSQPSLLHHFTNLTCSSVPFDACCFHLGPLSFRVFLVF